MVERACAKLYLPECAAGVSSARLATCAPEASAGIRGGGMGMGQPSRAGGHMHVPDRYWLLADRYWQLTCARGGRAVRRPSPPARTRRALSLHIRAPLHAAQLRHVHRQVQV